MLNSLIYLAPRARRSAKPYSILFGLYIASHCKKQSSLVIIVPNELKSTKIYEISNKLTYMNSAFSEILMSLFTQP